MKKLKLFTIIELIVVIVIISIVATTTFSFIADMIKSADIVNTQSRYVADLRWLLARTGKLVDKAKTVSANGNTFTFNLPNETVELRWDAADNKISIDNEFFLADVKDFSLKVEGEIVKISAQVGSEKAWLSVFLNN
ncbi:MAG: prepilin-type N-terminal cleavage/methylation domain-containing protein [Lentisphaeria bacterium]